jgi:hypothetical protein
MDSALRGWVIGHLLDHAINRHREAQPHWGAVAYSEITAMGWVWSSNHRSARAALTRCHGPHPRLWACRPTSPSPSPADPAARSRTTGPAPACTSALARCQATYPTTPTATATTSGSLLLDTRHGVLYQH